MHWVDSVLPYWPLLLKGLLMTLLLAGISILTASIAGFLWATAHFYRIFPFSWFYTPVVYAIRAVPLMMALVLIHFGVLPLLGISTTFFISAWVGLSIIHGAYFAEIFRGGYETLSQSEIEASQSLGLEGFTLFRQIVLPLVWMRVIPVIVNQTVTLIKDTSLAGLIGVIELSRAAEIVAEKSLFDAPMLILTGLMYFMICSSVAWWGKKAQSQTLGT